jgi:hypothetical protein
MEDRIMDTEQGPECPPPDYNPGFHDDEEPTTTPEEYMRRRKRAAARSRAPRPLPAVLMPEVHDDEPRTTGEGD